MKFKVSDGITSSQIKELIDHSNTDELIMQSTSDTKRFKDKNSFDEWSKKGRKIYVMTDFKNTLHGIIWFGRQSIPTNKQFTKPINLKYYEITFAIRLYEKARGKRLARDFMNQAFDKFRLSPQYLKIKQKGVWLETYERNKSAVGVYEKFGFEKVSKPDKNGRIIMILTNSIKNSSYS